MKSCFASSTLATSANVTPMFGSIWNFALDLPKARGFRGPPGGDDAIDGWRVSVRHHDPQRQKPVLP
jgi:hypothetical protein